MGTSTPFSLNATGGSTYSWSVAPGSSLPTGMSLVPAGVLSSSTSFLAGAPSTPGNYTFTLRATDNANTSSSADRLYSLRVAPMQFVQQNALLPVARLGSPL